MVALLVLAFAPARAADKLPADPDFSWASKCSSQVRAGLALARTDWRAASVVPPKDAKSSERRFDEHYFHELLDGDDASYGLLDSAVRRLKSLEDCKAEYAKAIKLAGKSAPAAAAPFDPPYYLLRSRIRIGLGLARASVAIQMTGPDTSNYCFEAMESAIDALRDSADDAAKVPGGARRADSIRKLRTILFDVWESAQRSKDTRLIGEIDLVRAFDRSGLLDTGQTQSRL